jgi:hypothetical protein
MPDIHLPTIVSGNGDTIETAVRFTPCDIPTRVKAERRYISERFGIEGADWQEKMHFTRPGFISDWIIELADGTNRSVYFDATVSFE